jgi:hypothetical protein
MPVRGNSPAIVVFSFSELPKHARGECFGKSREETVLKPLGLIVFLTAGIFAVGCGSSNSSSTNVNGNWSVSLVNASDGSTAYTFTTSLNQNSGGSVSVTNFKLTSTGSCFVDGQTNETGNFTLSGDFSGNVKGTFGMTISSTTNTGTQLVLQGGVGHNNTITGTWSLTGSTACSGQGTFVFTRM